MRHPRHGRRRNGHRAHVPRSGQARDPVLFVVSMMDKEHADFDRIDQQIKLRLTNKVIPSRSRSAKGAAFHGIVNLFTQARAPVQARREDGRVRRDGHSRGGARGSSIATTVS